MHYAIDFNVHRKFVKCMVKSSTDPCNYPSQLFLNGQSSTDILFMAQRQKINEFPPSIFPAHMNAQSISSVCLYFCHIIFCVCCDFWVKIICSLSWLESSKFCQFLWDFFFVLVSDLLADGYLSLLASLLEHMG